MRPARNTWRTSSGEGRRIVWKPTVVSIRRWMMMRPGDRTGNPRILPEKMKNLLRRMMTRCHRVGFHSIRRRGTSRIDAPNPTEHTGVPAGATDQSGTRGSTYRPASPYVSASRRTGSARLGRRRPSGRTRLCPSGGSCILCTVQPSVSQKHK